MSNPTSKTVTPERYRFEDLGGGTMRMVSVANPAWHSCYDGEWIRADHHATEIARLDALMQADAATIVRQGEEIHRLRAQLRSSRETTASRSVTLNGYQLKAALEFIAPDDDPDQLESEVSIQWGDAGHSGAGYYACMTEYPEEGSIVLDDKAPESSEKSNGDQS